MSRPPFLPAPPTTLSLQQLTVSAKVPLQPRPPQPPTHLRLRPGCSDRRNGHRRRQAGDNRLACRFGATSYNIYWATTSGVTTAGTKITAATSPYVQTGLAASTTYYYIVTAVNAAGQSAASAQVSAATNAPVVTIPAAPTGVTASRRCQSG